MSDSDLLINTDTPIILTPLINVDTSICNIDNINNIDNIECGFNVENNEIQNTNKKDHKKDINKDINKEDVNITIKSCKNITSKQALLIIPITTFFKKRITLNKLIVILKGESLSLRLIDWFVTNYSKKFNLMYDLNNYRPITTNTSQHKNSFDNVFMVHNNYKGQLKAYSKRNFDPFCRRNRIRFYYEENKYFITTVGQLNFFKWAIENYIINYVQDNIKIITDDMNLRCEIKTNKQTKLNILSGAGAGASAGTTIKTEEDTITIDNPNEKTRKGATRKKRNAISQSAAKSLSIHKCSTTLVFD